MEDSVEGILTRWSRHAVMGRAYGRSEGSPLLEVALGDTVLQLFERTGPYLAPVGPVRVVVQAVTEVFDPSPAQGRSLQASGLSRLQLHGQVVEADGPWYLVDAGIPVLVGLDPRGPGADDGHGEDLRWRPQPGDWVSCDSLAPLHGFVVPGERRDRVSGSTDELV